jgi:hypothetical protein
MIKFTYDLNNINSTAITYNFESSCSTPYGYSIIYISPFKIYSIVIDLDCGFTLMLKDYLLIENITECDNIKNHIKEGAYSESENEEDNDDKESTQKIQSTEIKESAIGPSEKLQHNYDTIHITYQPHINVDGKTNQNTESIQIKETIQNTLNKQIIETEIEDLQSSIQSELTQSINNSKITESPKNSYSSSSTDFLQETSKETELIQNTIEPKIESNEITDSNIIESNNITDSSRLKESSIITDSSRLIESSEIIDSTKFIESSEIFDTSDKIKSNEITDFSKITESSNIINSPKITDSSKTIEFTQIDSSQNIETSETIISSQIKVYDSLQIIESSEISESLKTIDSSTYSESTLISDINKSSKIVESSQMIKSYELTEYLSKATQKEKIICDKKCLECDEESNARNLCIKCNNNNNYFELKLKNQIIENNQNYIECYSEETKIPNYYLNKKDKVFESCFYTCGTCKELGDQNDHKCLTCANNYRRNPHKNNSCVMECKNFFYFTNFGEYLCTIDNQCPEEANLLIKNLSKCTNDCKNEG